MIGVNRRVIGMLVAAAILPACGTSGGGTLTPTVAPAIPASVTVAQGNKRATIHWTSLSTGATFVVKRSLTSGGPYFPISVPGQFPTPTSYVDLGLTNGTNYYYVVSASNQFGQSGDSAEAQGTPGFNPIRIVSTSSALHTIAILPDRSAWAWGGNDKGQLGNGFSSGQSGSPDPIKGLQDVTSAAAGLSFSLALTNDGRVWAWGDNTYGILGDGTTSATPVPIPQPVPNLDGVVALAAGDAHALALKNDGTIWAWGDNQHGQLGVGPLPSPVTSPTLIPGFDKVASIAAGFLHSMAVRQDGTVWGWGNNQYGEAGTGAVTGPVFSPSQVENITSVSGVSLGNGYSLALRSDGTLWFWGGNTLGQFGDGTVGGNVLRPTKVPNLTEVTGIAAGPGSSYVLRSNGTVWAWGDNSAGQLGIGVISLRETVPTKVLNAENVVAIAAGRWHGLCLDAEGAVRGWGANTLGQVGNGTGRIHDFPMPIPNLTDVLAVSAGNVHTVALRQDGTVWGWGWNYKGQVGYGSVGLIALPPGRVSTLTGMTAVAAGSAHSLALKDDGSVWGWGDNSQGQLGQGAVSASPVTTPVQVVGVTNVVAIAAGAYSGVALRNDGTVWHWGDVDSDVGPNGPIPSATLVPGLSGITAISSGWGHVLALKDDGTVWAWGDNTSGQRGNGGISAPAAPAAMLGLTGVVQVSGGFQHSLALRSDGTVWACGRISLDGSQLHSLAQRVTTPGPILGVSGATAAWASSDRNAILLGDGQYLVWGTNSFGALGTGDETPRLTPVAAPLLSGMFPIALGVLHGVGIMPDRTLQAWGYNENGQMGVPVLDMVSTPTLITP